VTRKPRHASIKPLALAAATVCSGWLLQAAQNTSATQPWTFVASGDARNCGSVVMPAIADTARAAKAAFYWHLGDFRRMAGQDEDIVNLPQHLVAPLTSPQYRAMAWQGVLDRHYAQPDAGRYYLTADDAEGLVVRPQSTFDEAVPNHNGLIAQNLVRLAALAGDDGYRIKVDKLFDSLLPLAAESLFNHVSPLNALDLRLRAAEIVVTGEGPQADALVAAALKLPFLDRILLRAARADALPASHPARDKVAATGGQPAAFVCVGERCSLPVVSPDKIAEAAGGMRAS